MNKQILNELPFKLKMCQELISRGHSYVAENRQAVKTDSCYTYVQFAIYLNINDITVSQFCQKNQINDLLLFTNVNFETMLTPLIIITNCVKTHR